MSEQTKTQQSYFKSMDPNLTFTTSKKLGTLLGALLRSLGPSRSQILSYSSILHSCTRIPLVVTTLDSASIIKIELFVLQSLSSGNKTFLVGCDTFSSSDNHPSHDHFFIWWTQCISGIWKSWHRADSSLPRARRWANVPDREMG